MQSNKIPILEIEGILVASIQVEMHDASALQFKQDIGDRISATGARGLVLDLTAVEIVDSFMGRIVNEIGQMSRLMGAAVVISGLQPAVAITLVELGLALPGVQTALNLEQGMNKLRTVLKRG